MVARHFRLLANARQIKPSSDLEYLIKIAINEATAPDVRNNDLQLDIFVRSVAEQLKQIATRRKLKGTISGLIDSFRDEAQSMCCTTCARNAGAQPCNGTMADDAVLGAGMACWDFLFSLFAHLLKLAHQHYGPLLPDVGSQELAVELHTRIAAGRELGAETRFSDDHGTRRRAQVILDLPEEDLAQRHLHHLPYMLFHEIFVHAAESWLEPASRRPTHERCPFREGFVDAASAYLLEHTLASRSDALPGPYQQFSSDFAREVRHAHSTRLSLDDPEFETGTEEAMRRQGIILRRREGRSAFEDVADVAGFDNACQLAIAVNLLSLTNEQRQLFVELFYDVAKAQSGNRRQWLQRLLAQVGPGKLQMLRDDILKELAQPDF